MATTSKRLRTGQQVQQFRAVLTGALDQLDCTDGQALTLRGAIGALDYVLGEPAPTVTPKLPK